MGARELRKAIYALTFSTVLFASLFALLLVVPVSQPTVLTNGYNSDKPCTPMSEVQASVTLPNGRHAYMVVIPTTISIQVQVFAPNGTQVAGGYVCDKTIVNSGLDNLATLIGNNGAAITLYMVASTATSVSGTDSSCPSALTTNGFTVQSILATYAHSAGTSTFTSYGLWTYTGTSVTVTDMCLTQSSSNAANGLIDETIVNGVTGYYLQTNYVFKETVTGTV